jgi:hypothetical protein
MVARTLTVDRHPRTWSLRQPHQHVRRALPPVDLDEAAQEVAGENLELGQVRRSPARRRGFRSFLALVARWGWFVAPRS